jgi:hypothetical protein
MQTEQ